MTASDALTVIPWYDERDFDAMLSMSGRRHVPGGYRAWMREAAGAAREAREAGGAVQFIAVRPQEYRRWLGDRKTRNSPDARIAFLKDLVTRQRMTA